MHTYRFKRIRGVAGETWSGLEISVYSTSSVDFPLYTLTVMCSSHVSDIFFLFLISNRALVLPSEEERKKFNRNPYTHFNPTRLAIELIFCSDETFQNFQ